MKVIELLVPCYNEEAVLKKFYQRTCGVLAKLHNYDFRFIFVNDGSRDKTLDIMRQLYKRDARVSYVSLSRNFGKEAAMLAGMDYADGDALVIMDADLQDPPELLPEMISWWEKGYKDVSARRTSRDGESFFKKWSSKTYYKLLQKVTSVPMQRDVGDFRLLDKRCVQALRRLRESQRYTKGLYDWIGFEKKEIYFERPARAAGKTKWNYWQLFNLAVDGITSFTTAPLRMASFAGCALALIAVVYMLYIVGKTLVLGGDVPGYPSLISVVLFIGGIQLMFMGIMGEYIGRIFNESKRRPSYITGEAKMAREKSLLSAKEDSFAELPLLHRL